MQPPLHPEAAAAFASYMTSAENQKHYSIDTTSPPAVVHSISPSTRGK